MTSVTGSEREGWSFRLHDGFSSLEYDHLVARARYAKTPAERQERYVQAERLLCETEAAVTPIFHTQYNMP